MGLDLRRQEVSWEESESNKKQKGGDKKKAADRYFSTVSRQLLRSHHPVLMLPVIPECGDVIDPASFLPLGDAEGENKAGERGNTLGEKAATLTSSRGLVIWSSNTSQPSKLTQILVKSLNCVS